MCMTCRSPARHRITGRICEPMFELMAPELMMPDLTMPEWMMPELMMTISCLMARVTI
jgi:hypothetical protein